MRFYTFYFWCKMTVGQYSERRYLWYLKDLGVGWGCRTSEMVTWRTARRSNNKEEEGDLESSQGLGGRCRSEVCSSG